MTRARPADIGGTDSSSAGYSPEWPFGYGLSYTTFRYDDMRVPEQTLGAADTLTVRVTVTNSGPREGREPILLYVRELVASVTPPMRRLRAFDAVTLAAGETRTITLRVPVRDLSFVGRTDRLVLEPGEFDVMVGPFTTRFRVR